jgi:hypothetical protein
MFPEYQQLRTERVKKTETTSKGYTREYWDDEVRYHRLCASWAESPAVHWDSHEPHAGAPRNPTGCLIALIATGALFGLLAGLLRSGILPL